MITMVTYPIYDQDDHDDLSIGTYNTPKKTR